MSIRWIALILVILGGVTYIQYLNEPHNTHLPLDLKDLPRIQSQIDKLPPEERELLLGYLKRSNGDVLPAKFADPDSPFTARTIGEAIQLQREWLARDGARQVVADQRAAAREESMQPLRAVVDVRLVRRQILTHDEIYGLPQDTTNTRGEPVKHALNDREALVITWRLRNLSPRTVAVAKGSVALHDAAGKKVAECWVDENNPLPGGETREFRCGNTRRGVSDEDRAFVTASAMDYTLVWEPQEVVFDDGTSLKANR
jgi:hypothetical protein